MKQQTSNLEQQLKLSAKETKELLILTMYKLSLVRAQVEVLSDLVIKKGLITPEELWQRVGERFEDEEQPL